MRIQVLTTFKEGTGEFVQGETRMVLEEDGQRFINNGWAAAEGVVIPEVPPTPVANLDVRGVKISTGVKNG